MYWNCVVLVSPDVFDCLDSTHLFDCVCDWQDDVPFSQHVVIDKVWSLPNQKSVDSIYQGFIVADEDEGGEVHAMKEQHDLADVH